MDFTLFVGFGPYLKMFCHELHVRAVFFHRCDPVVDRCFLKVRATFAAMHRTCSRHNGHLHTVHRIKKGGTDTRHSDAHTAASAADTEVTKRVVTELW